MINSGKSNQSDGLLRICVVLLGFSVGAGLATLGMATRVSLPTTAAPPTGDPRDSGNLLATERLTHLLALTCGTPLNRHQRQSLLAELDAWLLSDPVECLNRLHDSGIASLLRTEEVEAAIAQLCPANPAQQITLAQQIRSARWRDGLIQNAFSQLLKANLEQALSVFPTLEPKVRARLGAKMGAAFGQTGKTDLVQKFLQNPSTSPSMIHSAMEAWVRKDSKAAFAFLQQWQTTTPQIPVPRSLRPLMWREGDPAVALDDIQAQAPSGQRDHALASALGALIAQTPSRAAELLAPFQAEGASLPIYAAVARQAARSNPTLATEYLQKIPGERARTELARAITRELIYSGSKNPSGRPSDFSALKAWIATTNDPLIRLNANQELAFQHLSFRVDGPGGVFTQSR